MPSNNIQINYSEQLSWEVPDSKMENLIKVLSEIGIPHPQNTLKVKNENFSTTSLMEVANYLNKDK